MECLKHCLMSRISSIGMEDRGPQSDLNCRRLTQEVSEEENFSMLSRNCSCDILVKKVAAFCPCPKNLPEAKVKNFGLIPLTEEISKQPRIDFVVRLLLFMLIKIYNEKKQADQGK